MSYANIKIDKGLADRLKATHPGMTFNDILKRLEKLGSPKECQSCQTLKSQYTTLEVTWKLQSHLKENERLKGLARQVVGAEPKSGNQPRREKGGLGRSGEWCDPEW